MSQHDKDGDMGSMDDDLLQRHHQAGEQDVRRPGKQVKNVVRDRALMLLAAQSATATATASASVQGETPDRNMPAANQSHWKISAFASLALAGLTGLLVLQFDRSAQDDRGLALGQHGATAPVLQEEPIAPAMSKDATAKQAPPSTRVDRGRDENSEATKMTKKSESVASTDRKATMPAEPSGTSAEASSSSPPALASRVSPPAAARQDSAAMLRRAVIDGRTADVERLIEQGAPLDGADNAGRTPLMLAVIHGHSALVQKLLSAGANPALTDRGGFTALQHARRLSLQDIAVLLQGPP